VTECNRKQKRIKDIVRQRYIEKKDTDKNTKKRDYSTFLKSTNLFISKWDHSLNQESMIDQSMFIDQIAFKFDVDNNNN